jgi:hypothetical protein
MRDHIWRTRDGRLIPVRQMTTDHIINCIRLIQERQGLWRRGYLARLQMELNYRNSGRK